MISNARVVEAMDARLEALAQISVDAGWADELARISRQHARGTLVTMPGDPRGRAHKLEEIAKEADAITQTERMMLKTATPFIWDAPILRAVYESQQTLPDVTLTNELIPVKSGWWYFGPESMVMMEVSRRAGLQETAEALAYIVAEQDGHEWLVMSAYGRPKVGGMRLRENGFASGGIAMPAGAFQAFWGGSVQIGSNISSLDDPAVTARLQAAAIKLLYRQNWNGITKETEAKYGQAYFDDTRALFRLFAAGCLWMRQRVLVATPTVVERHARRRTERAGLVTSAIRPMLIHLRKTEHAKAAEDAHAAALSGRTYHCQWVVRGHWRQQFYRSTGQHRPRWIEPYVKGPDGSPLKTTSKIFAVDR